MYSVASSFKNHITFSCRLPLKALKKTINCFWKLFSVRLSSLESFSLRNKTFMIFDIIRRMVTTSGRTEFWLVYRGKVLFVALVVFLLWCCFVNSVLEYQAICITLFLFEFWLQLWNRKWEKRTHFSWIIPLSRKKKTNTIIRKTA